MTSNLLSFGLPTYNRAEILREALEHYYNVLKLQNYKLIISDNCSTDDTPKIVAEFMEKYDNIEFYRQEKNIGADRNMLFVQDKANTDYFILLGDGVRFYPDKLNKIISLAKTHKYDAILCDYKNRSKVPTQVYTEKNKMLAEIGWYLSQMSSVVLKKEILKNTVNNRYVYEGCEFNYYIPLFVEMSRRNLVCYWLSEDCMTFTSIEKKNSWNKRLASVWIREFTSTILSLPPNYSLDAKLQCLKEMGKYPLFNNQNMFNHMKQGILTSEQISKYRFYINAICKHSWKYYYFFSKMPQWGLFLIILGIRILKKIKKSCFPYQK